jgi:hypothetical protein
MCFPPASVWPVGRRTASETKYHHLVHTRVASLSQTSTTTAFHGYLRSEPQSIRFGSFTSIPAYPRHKRRAEPADPRLGRHGEPRFVIATIVWQRNAIAELRWISIPRDGTSHDAPSRPSCIFYCTASHEVTRRSPRFLMRQETWS